MPKLSRRPTDAATIRVLIRIARAAFLAADDLLLRSAEIELAEFGLTLSDIGVDADTTDVEVDRG